MALFSQRIGSKTMMISDHPTDPNFCYTWSRGGRLKENGLQRYVCTGCRKIKDRKDVDSITKLPARCAIVGAGVWAKEDEEPIHPHFCQPIPKSKILGIEQRREIKVVEYALGLRGNSERSGSSANEDEWAENEQTDSILIREVQAHPEIYDTAHCNYRNNEHKTKLWSDIALNFEKPVFMLKKRWTYLRDHFYKELRKCKQSTPERQSEWIHYESMQWLQPFLRHTNFAGKNVRSIKNEDVNVSSKKQKIYLDILPNRKGSAGDVQNEVLPFESSIQQSTNEMILKTANDLMYSRQQETKEELFGRRIAIELGQMSRQTADYAMLKIEELLYNIRYTTPSSNHANGAGNTTNSSSGSSTFQQHQQPQHNAYISYVNPHPIVQQHLNMAPPPQQQQQRNYDRT